MSKYNTDIALGAQIQPGFYIAHYNGVVMSTYCRIGKNFTIRQNTTIGLKSVEKPDKEYCLSFGDNVTIGANCCIIGDKLDIGNNVVIGAMSFVNKDIADDTVYYQKRVTFIKKK